MEGLGGDPAPLQELREREGLSLLRSSFVGRVNLLYSAPRAPPALNHEKHLTSPTDPHDMYEVCATFQK
ncbi:hypothetical protein M7I_6228 [Glarea lozoyensis 74030]|uniref:Uncharacterized protein n=1 Tax=Glarea lozoyensis (strain ATCC 74030 / MF5533) TaxID=1104152 RepID=H0EU03_GLAL7|nr:hypothetical protein M7I_6228 [Glarea lozoyensis 74030]